MAVIYFTDIDDDWIPSIDEETNGDDEWHGAGGNDNLIGDRWFGIPGGVDQLFGDAGNDTLDGGAGADRLIGGDHNDLLDGDGTAEGFPDYDKHMGADYLDGGAGNDELKSQGGNDTLIGGAGADTFNAGSGFDLADYSNAGGAVRVVIGEAGKGSDAEGDILSGNIEHIKGSLNFGDLISGWSTDDLLEGQGGNDQLYGQGGEDTLRGGSGDDELYGMGGEDEFYGGDGAHDRVIYFAQAEAVIITIGVGRGAGGDASGDFIASDVEDLIGSNFGGDILTGSQLNNTLEGHGGDDTLRGLIGDDTLFGGGGNDRLEGGLGGDRMNGGSGIDQAEYNFATAGIVADLLAPNVNQGEAAGDTYFSIENLKGTAYNDQLLGNDLDNTMGGNNGGDDRLVGRGGDDTLAGGNGADSLSGGLGNDTYLLDDTTQPNPNAVTRYDQVNEDQGSGTDLALVNSDAPSSSVFAPSYTLAANLENATLTGSTDFGLRGNELDNLLTGNGANNRLTGQAGNDTLIGGRGQDLLEGGLGNDRYILEDTFADGKAGISRYDEITEAPGGGIDRAVINSDAPSTSISPSYTLGANMEIGQLNGSTRFSLFGNELDNFLYGNTNANLLRGLAGKDWLDGGLGGDTLEGGAGNDTYALDDTFIPSKISVERYDIVTEAANGGIDTVRVSQQGGQRSYRLGDNIENGVVTGPDAFGLLGNALANDLTGNAASNRLIAGNGDDLLRGGAGRDGMTGGGGADTLAGGLGGDILEGNVGGDIFDFNALAESGLAAAARDRIVDFVRLADRINVSTIDAIAAAAGNNAFSFIGNSAFTAAGQIRATQTGADTLVELNVGGTLAADAAILLNDFQASTLRAADFVL